MSKSIRNVDNSFGEHLTATQRKKKDTASEIAAALSGRFEIVETIVESENCALYLARDLSNSEPETGGSSGLVRLKALLESAAGDSRQVELFHLEARAAAKLSHKNIIKSYEAEEVGGIHFCVTQHKPDAQTLRDLLKREGWFEVAQAVEIIKQIAAALDYAHSLGVLHLTLQPEKILVEPDGSVLVTDFGIEFNKDYLWAHQERSHRCAAQYISPEQVQCKQIDQRSDLYSLGVVMFEMLTDRVPFDSPDSISIKLKHLNRLPEPPHMFRPELPRLLCWLVMDLLKKKPDERPTNIEMFQSMLQQFMDSGLEAGSAAGEPAAVFDSGSQFIDGGQAPVEQQSAPEHLVSLSTPEHSVSFEQETAMDSSDARMGDASADEDTPQTNVLPLIITDAGTPVNEAHTFSDVEAQNVSDEVYLADERPDSRVVETSPDSESYLDKESYDEPSEATEAFARTSQMMPEMAEATSKPRSHRAAWLAAILLIAAACMVWALRAPRVQDSVRVEEPVLATDANSGSELDEAPKSEQLKSEELKSETAKSEESKSEEPNSIEPPIESGEAHPAQAVRSAVKNEDETADKPAKQIEPVASMEQSQQVKSPVLNPPAVSIVPAASDTQSSTPSIASGDISIGARPSEPPPAIQPPKREEPPAPRIVRRSGDVLQNSAISRVRPIYPEAAKSARMAGPVTVEVTVDEEGNVIAARAISGPELLKDAAVDAARRWKWMPTRMDRTRVKVVGTITLSFQR